MPKKILFITIILIIALLTSCGSSGTLSVKITDAPINGEDIAEVYIAVSRLEVHTADPDEWVTLKSFDPPKEVELLALAGGNTEALGDFTLPAGRVTQMRFYLDPGSSYLYETAAPTTKVDMTLPGDAPSGFKAVGSFEVPANGVVELVMDFDVRKSLGTNSGGYFLKPTVRLVVEDLAGRIGGSFEDAGGDLAVRDIVIYAYETGDYTDAEDDAPAEGETYFPNAVNSGEVHDGDGDGTHGYTIPFLALGGYDLYAVEWDIDGNPTVLNGGSAAVEAVVVDSGKGSTTANIQLP